MAQESKANEKDKNKTNKKDKDKEIVSHGVRGYNLGELWYDKPAGIFYQTYMSVAGHKKYHSKLSQDEEKKHVSNFSQICGYVIGTENKDGINVIVSNQGIWSGLSHVNNDDMSEIAKDVECGTKLTENQVMALIKENTDRVGATNEVAAAHHLYVPLLVAGANVNGDLSKDVLSRYFKVASTMNVTKKKAQEIIDFYNLSKQFKAKMDKLFI